MVTGDRDVFPFLKLKRRQISLPLKGKLSGLSIACGSRRISRKISGHCSVIGRGYWMFLKTEQKSDVAPPPGKDVREWGPSQGLACTPCDNSL